GRRCGAGTGRRGEPSPQIGHRALQQRLAGAQGLLAVPQIGDATTARAQLVDRSADVRLSPPQPGELGLQGGDPAAGTVEGAQALVEPGLAVEQRPEEVAL